MQTGMGAEGAVVTDAGSASLGSVGLWYCLREAASSAIGVAYSLNYAYRTTPGPVIGPLVIEVASLHRRGRHRGAGTGRLEVTGSGAGRMLDFIQAAKAWVCANHERILAFLAVPPGSPEWEWDWAKEDLHVHLTNAAEMLEMGCVYTAAVAVAMVSFFTLRYVCGCETSGAGL